MDTTPEKAAQVVALIEAGQNQSAVARQLNISRYSVRRVYQRYRETGGFERRRGSGRARATTQRDNRFLVTTALRNRRLTAVELAQQLQQVREVVVSRWTVRRRLAEGGLTAHRPANGPKLTPAHRRARFRFAQEHVNWTADQWKAVLFSDESRMCLHDNDGRGRVYRRRSERFSQCCITERVAYGGGSCMFWGGISLERKTELVFIVGANIRRQTRGLTSQRYIEEVLQEHVVPFGRLIGSNFLFMHDNARPHTAAIVRQYLQEVNVPVMEWPARSPDLNPIEHLWDELKRKIRGRNSAPANLQELQNALKEEWDAMPQDFIRNLIESMGNRCEAVIRARGGNTCCVFFLLIPKF